MDFFYWGKSALLFAFLTKGMSFDISISNSFPTAAISFIRLRVPLILVIVSVHGLLMALTVATLG
jgi:hypothetical protein